MQLVNLIESWYILCPILISYIHIYPLWSCHICHQLFFITVWMSCAQYCKWDLSGLVHQVNLSSLFSRRFYAVSPIFLMCISRGCRFSMTSRLIWRVVLVRLVVSRQANLLRLCSFCFIIFAFILFPYIRHAMSVLVWWHLYKSISLV